MGRGWTNRRTAERPSSFLRVLRAYQDNPERRAIKALPTGSAGVYRPLSGGPRFSSVMVTVGGHDHSVVQITLLG